MRGSLLAIWSRTGRELWGPLARQAPGDLHCELYRALAPALKAPPELPALVAIIDDPPAARRAFQRVRAEHLQGEAALLVFLQGLPEVLAELGGEALANLYFNRLDALIHTYNLHYELRRPCRLYPTLPGAFAQLLQQLRHSCASHDALHTLLRDFDEAFRDLHDRPSQGRIKTCLQKQMNLLEALGRDMPYVKEYALSSICDEVAHWPHRKVRDALKLLYGFTCDYPGVRHGGKPGSVLGELGMRDLLALCILFIGFTPYLSGRIDADAIFPGL
ncbi:hypothetical protein [Metapseudomonas otitidis]|uniref:hypothetical protein n=1 Tax=Metapseudomonas otitidis TaxID=319939 RepID=UPI00244CBEA9|nr:hypothetical protein [Pseudomonas otitidis]MDH0336461.1 hypothetical protein [Pseudomonas otitidis]